MSIYRYYFKHLLDFITALFAIFLLLPFYIVIFIGLKLVLRQDAFFVQLRPGKKGKIFKLIKFKTMNDRKNQNGDLLPDDQRITNFGKFLRLSSLDELPQLFNVIKGDMSIVGPRPLMPKYLPLYSKEQFRRHDVRPGITGWAQINGRNNLSWKKKFELDVWYVDNISFFLDIKIIFLTIKKVLLRENIAKEGHATTVAFNGKN